MNMKSLILFAAILVVQLSEAHAVPRKYSMNKKVAPERLYQSSFEETFERYPSPYAIVQHFKRIYPGLGDSYHTCLRVEDNAAVMGAIDPLQGAALEDVPGPMFYSYYADCVRQLATTSSISYTFYESVFGIDLYIQLRREYLKCDSNVYRSNECDANLLADPARAYYISSFKFSEISPNLQIELVKKMIQFIVGPKEISETFGFIGKTTVFGVALLTEEELARFFIDNIKSRDGSDGELKLIDFYAELALILRLGPLIRN